MSRKLDIPGALQSGLESLILTYFLGVCFAAEADDPKLCFTFILYRREEVEDLPMLTCLSDHPDMLYRPLFTYEISLYSVNFSGIFVGQEGVFTEYSRWAHMIHMVTQG